MLPLSLMPLIRMQIRPQPVSYTHLDVYKRQPLPQYNGKSASPSWKGNNPWSEKNPLWKWALPDSPVPLKNSFLMQSPGLLLSLIHI